MAKMVDKILGYLKIIFGYLWTMFRSPDEQQKRVRLFSGLTIVVLWGYWNSLSDVAIVWETPQYSHGYLIPFFCLVMLWLERKPVQKPSVKEMWIGVALIAFSAAVRLFATDRMMYTVDYISLIPSLLGVVMLVGGTKLMRWAGPPIGFTVFMFPWPNVLVNKLMTPLQSLATYFSDYGLTTLGVNCYREGNVIHLPSMSMGVVDACSGLRMLTIFVALCVAIAMLLNDRPWWERLVIVLSAIPIALAVNIFRITVTGVLFSLEMNDIANKVFHDYAGYVMMPIAMGLLFIEYEILQRLTIEQASGIARQPGISPVGMPKTPTSEH